MISRIGLPSSEELKAILDYDPETGVLTWRTRPATSKVNKNFNARFAGKKAGTIESWGYRQLRILGKLQMAHRVIWKMVAGDEPPDHLDHRDGDPSNNKWTNLRGADPHSNAWNKSLRRNNTSGVECIFPLHRKRSSSKQFRVLMYYDGKKAFLGDFHTLEEAKAAHFAAFAKHRDISFKR
jgi:hypothetical protein